MSRGHVAADAPLRDVAESDPGVGSPTTRSGSLAIPMGSGGDCERRGPGRRSSRLAAVEAHARAAGVLGLRLTASLNAVPFYAARGYVAVRHREHELSRGGILDVVDMTKRLGSCEPIDEVL